MRRRLAIGVVLLAGLALALPTSGKPSKLPADIPVTVTFTDGSLYAIQSDGRGPYVHGLDGVRAVLVPLGNLALDTDYTKTPVPRTLSLDFTACSASPCGAPDPTLAAVAFVSTSSCDLAGGLPGMPVGGSQECNLNVNFPADGLGWFIRFGEDDGTEPASVTRASPTTWTIEVPPGGVAKLLSYPTKGRMVLTDRGSYIMPVHLTVTLP